jgi:dsRNA-specific ribonuclease
MLIIVFTESEPSNIVYSKLKEEMERLEFFGDSVINTAVIMNLYLKYQGSLSEK